MTSSAVLALLLAVAAAQAQEPAPSTTVWSRGEPNKILIYRKEPTATTLGTPRTADDSAWGPVDPPPASKTMYFTKEPSAPLPPPPPVIHTPAPASAAAKTPAASPENSAWRPVVPPALKTISAKQPSALLSPPPPSPAIRTSAPASAAAKTLAASPVANTPLRPSPAIQLTSMQARRPTDARPPAEEVPGYQVPLEEVPGRDRLFRLESEAELRNRIRQESKGRPGQERVTFPEDPVLSKKPYTARAFSPMQELAEPAYVCYHRLLFEEKNSERYGWEVGYMQPFLSAGYFFKDVALLPYHLATAPCRRYECSAGQCLPGDPVPYLLYPPDWSLTGTAAELSVIVALAFIFP